MNASDEFDKLATNIIESCEPYLHQRENDDDDMTKLATKIAQSLRNQIEEMRKRWTQATNLVEHNLSEREKLIAQLIEARAMRKKAEWLIHHNTWKPFMYVGGSRVPNPHYNWIDTDWIEAEKKGKE